MKLKCTRKIKNIIGVIVKKQGWLTALVSLLFVAMISMDYKITLFLYLLNADAINLEKFWLAIAISYYLAHLCMPDFFIPQYPRHYSLVANKRSYIAYIVVLYFCSLLCFIPFLTMVPGDDFVVHLSWLWCEGCINGRVTSHTISVFETSERKCSDMYFFLVYWWSACFHKWISIFS